MKGVQIYEQEITNKKGKVVGKVAILRGGLYTDNPTETMNNVVTQYVGGELHCQFTEITLCNPWTRIIISGINDFDYYTTDQIKRSEKLSKIMKKLK